MIFRRGIRSFLPIVAAVALLASPALAADVPDPLPGPEPSPVPDFVAIAGLDKTAAENKAVIDPIRANRAPRAEGGVGNINWERYQNIMDSNGDLLFENLTSSPTANCCWNSNLFLDPQPAEPRPGKYTWKNVAYDNKDAPGFYFGSREYNVPERFLIDCDFSNQSTYHSMYFSAYEDVTVLNTTFKNIAGQAMQLVNRPLAGPGYAANNVPTTKPVKVTVKDTHLIDCGVKPNAASWNFTMYGLGTGENPCTVTVEDCSFVSDWDEPRAAQNRQQPIHSTGGVIFTPNGGGGQPMPTTHNYDKVTFKNCLFDYTHMDRSFIELRSVHTAIIEDCAFMARECETARLTANKYIDREDLQLQHLIFRNVHVKTETSDPRHDTKVGMTFHWESGNYGDWTTISDISCPNAEKEFDADGVLVYEGPIRPGYVPGA